MSLDNAIAVYNVLNEIYPNFPQSDMDTCTHLHRCVLESPEGIIVEIGSAFGGSTVFLAEAAKECSKTVISIDPYPEGNYQFSSISKQWKDTFNQYILQSYDNVVQYNIDLRTGWSSIPDQFLLDNVAVAFIDGLHETEHAQWEFDFLRSKLVDGGIMLLDDAKRPLLIPVANCIAPPDFTDIAFVGITNTKSGVYRVR